MSGKGHRWAKGAATLIHKELSHGNGSPKSSLTACGPETIKQLYRAADPSSDIVKARGDLEQLERVSENIIESEATSGRTVPLHWRRLYTDCRLLHSLLDLQDPGFQVTNEETWEDAVSRLDMAIVVAGAAGEGRLDLILDAIELIQTEHLSMEGLPQNMYSAVYFDPSKELSFSVNALAPNRIPCIRPPPLSTFRSKFSHSPFVLPGFISDWPALTDHPWHSTSYLRKVAGRGRVVPVEVGSDYRSEEWRQKMLPWEDFLRGIGINEDAPFGAGDQTLEDEHNGLLYLAQHTLLTQFPALRSDIIVPDYVYASLPPPLTFPAYRPPCNDEQLVINAWLGPEGTVSPAHIDPYFNCYAQVAGRKTVWLAPPQLQDEMYPFPNPSHTSRQVSGDGDASPGVEPAGSSLANTSRVDVFSVSPDPSRFPLFYSRVRPHAFCSVLEPGDLLYIPPGWWHAMRSEDISFSVSMWF